MKIFMGSNSTWENKVRRNARNGDYNGTEESYGLND